MSLQTVREGLKTGLWTTCSLNTATTLGAGLLFGLAYGAGVIIQAIKEDNISKKDIYICYSFS